MRILFFIQMLIFSPLRPLDPETSIQGSGCYNPPLATDTTVKGHKSQFNVWKCGRASSDDIDTGYASLPQIAGDNLVPMDLDTPLSFAGQEMVGQRFYIQLSRPEYLTAIVVALCCLVSFAVPFHFA